MLTCFPLDVVRTRIMAAPIGSMPAPLTLMRDIARTEVGTSAERICPAVFVATPVICLPLAEMDRAP